MEAMDQRRLELYDLLKPALGDVPARRLVAALPPEPSRLATKDDLAALGSRLDARFAQIDARFAQMDARMDGRFRRWTADSPRWTAGSRTSREP